ncbi:hypothetical protein NST84_16610 [Paenibacillus sp. FSL R7-0345]|uniref:hypothetical protein n=1 Tax=Paenibacillus sp. FSL R7-0345 TaxID=2954535 RepID=UPI00315AFABC
MKKSMLLTAASVFLLSASILGACSNNETMNEAEPTASSAAATPVSEATASPEPAASPAATAAPASASPEAAPESSGRPQTQSFGEQEGGVPGQDGTLEQGDGYSLYIFDGYTFDAQTGRLALTADAEYYAEIEPLPASYDLAALKQQGQTELAAAGEPKDYSGELFEHPLRYAELYLQVSGEAGTHDYMVWKNEAGEAYLLRIHNQKGEPASQFSPWMTVSLSTIEGN